MVLSSVIQGSSGFDRGLLLAVGLGLTVLIFVTPVFGGFGISDSGFVLFLNLALCKTFKASCIRDPANKPLTAISIISFANGIDKVYLAIFGVAVKILELEYPNGRVFPKLIVDFYAHQNTVSDTKQTRLLHAYSILNYTWSTRFERTNRIEVKNDEYRISSVIGRIDCSPC